MSSIQKSVCKEYYQCSIVGGFIQPCSFIVMWRILNVSNGKKFLSEVCKKCLKKRLQVINGHLMRSSYFG